MVALLAGLSRSSAKALVSSGDVTVEGLVCHPSDRVAAHTLISVRLPEERQALLPEAVPFSVVYADESLAIVDKPAGIVMHPGAGVSSGTLASGVLERWPQLEGVGEEGRWGVVHRLDRDTSGLLVVALTQETFDALRTQMRDRLIEREYDALVHGHFEIPAGTIQAPIGRDAASPTRRAVSPSGKPAVTHYRVEASWSSPPVSRLTVTLETGRMHQIRVHMAEISHPIVGDKVYGRKAPPHLERMWLHARRLRLVHPGSGEVLEVTSPLPADLEAALEGLGRPG